MTQFNLGYKITAKDDTRSTLASALSGVTKFARVASKPIIIPLKVGRAGLGLLRDFNLGVRPLVAGLDNIIDRGGRLSLVSKSFQSLTGKNSVQAERLARSLVQASSGTLSFIKAQETANRALGSGLNLRQLTTAIEFISKKSITTGKNASQAIDTVITGLSRGSTLFLDDFGILVDGIDGVRRSFDKIKGIGAFDSLGPAKQKAEIINQAIAEMRVQMGKIGVTGRETTFVFQSLKNAVGDSVDKLFAAVAGSKTLRDTLQSTRDAIGGITKFIQGGGSVIEVLIGKKGGVSGGLLGIIKAGILDLAEAIGRAIAAGILKVAVRAGDILKQLNPFAGAGEKLKAASESITKAVGSILSSPPTAKPPGSKLRLSPRLPLKSSSLGRATTGLDIGGFVREGAGASLSALPSTIASSVAVAVGTRAASGVAGSLSRFVSKDIARNLAQERAIARTASKAGQFAAASPVGPPLIKRILLGSSEFIAKRLVPVATVADFGFTLFKFIKELKGLFKALDEVKAAKRFEQDAIERKRAHDKARGLTPADVIGMGFGGFSVLARRVEDTITSFTLLDKKINDLTKGGKTSRLGRRFRKAKSDFFKDFPAPEEKISFKLTPIEEDRKGRRLSPRGFLHQRGQINLLFRRIRIIAARTRQDAGLIANRRIAELRKKGFEVSREERQQIRDRTFDRLFKERTERPRARIRELQRELRDELERLGFRPLTSPQQQQSPLVQNIRDSVNEMKTAIGSLVTTVEKGIQAIAGTERRIVSAGAQRT